MTSWHTFHTSDGFLRWANLLFLGMWNTHNIAMSHNNKEASLSNLTSKQECGMYATMSPMFLGMVTAIATVVGMADGKFLKPYFNLK